MMKTNPNHTTHKLNFRMVLRITITYFKSISLSPRWQNFLSPKILSGFLCLLLNPNDLVFDFSPQVKIQNFGDKLIQHSHLPTEIPSGMFHRMALAWLAELTCTGTGQQKRKPVQFSNIFEKVFWTLALPNPNGFEGLVRTSVLIWWFTPTVRLMVIFI